MELSGPVHTKPEKYENAALFLWLAGLPSTLIGTKNELFENALQTGRI